MTTTENRDADLARENAELRRQLAEAQAQQDAVGDILQVINSSPGDLQPVFEAVLDRALRLCDAAFGVFFTFDGEFFRAAAFRGVPPALAEFSREPFRIGRGSVTRRLADGEAVVQTTDISAEGGGPGQRAVAELGGGRTAIGLALRKDNALLGFISIYRQEVRPFTDKQIALLQNFAAQAVIAMENARLLTETREALEQQTATAEVLQVINASPGDLAPVFDAILERALLFCQAAFGSMFGFDGEAFRRIAGRNAPSEFDPIAVEPLRAQAGSSLRRLVDGENLVTIEDIAASPLPSSLGGRAALVEAGARTMLWVALRKDDALVGAINIYRKEVRPFSDKQIALLQNFAAQAVIAMENARLLTETREALEQQTATAEVLQVINSSPGDLQPVFDAILRNAHAFCGAAKGALCLYEGEHFLAVATRGLSVEYETMLRAPHNTPGSPPARLLAGEHLVEIADFAAFDLPIPRAGVELEGARTVLFVPLRKGEALLGYITVYRQEVRPFTDKQIALLQSFAAQAVIAMENARLLTETREALEQQTATAEVLQVINSSPGDLQPVFDAILEKAHTLCGVEMGSLQLYDGEVARAVSQRGNLPLFAERLRQGVHARDNPAIEPLLSGHDFVHISDMAALDHWPAARLNKTSTLLSVPLRRGKLLGMIVAARREVRPFSDKQIALLQNFAAQAVIAMENARLLTETREALEQQTATAEVLQVINSSPGDLAPVFDAMLKKAILLCEADLGGMTAFDGDRHTLIASHGFPSEYGSSSDEPAPGSADYRLRQGENVVHVTDVTAEELYRAGDARRRRFADMTGARSAAWVALRKETALLGMFVVFRKEVRPFSDKQIALLQNFAAQAVIAMENARLLGELRQRTDEIAAINRDLEARVAAQVEELGRVGRLKRFLAPQLAEMIVSQGDDNILESHRREIVVMFGDLRGYSTFTETAEPEEVLEFLRAYHGALGPLVSQFEGTLDQFSGDAIMVFFNDPVPCPDPAERAVRMAIAMREAAGELTAQWRRRGRQIGFGVGIAQGYASLGQIGFAERSYYTAIGTVCNLASRLCNEAKDGQILVSPRVAAALEGIVPLEEIGNLMLRGLAQPVTAFNVAG